MPGTSRLVKVWQSKKPVKHSRKKPNFLVISSSRITRLFSKLQTLDKKVKSLKRKKNDTGACARHLLKEFVIVSESNALRSANAAVSDKELHLSRELSKSNLERKKLKRKVTGLEKEVEMVDILTANCDVAPVISIVQRRKCSNWNHSLQIMLLKRNI